MDALEKVTGRARYTADLHRARDAPRRVRARARRQRPGDSARPASPRSRSPGVRGRTRCATDVARHDRTAAPRCSITTIHWAGQPLAAIAADTLELARPRLRGSWRWRSSATPHAVTAEAALGPDAPRVRPAGNVPEEQPRVVERGDVDAARADADVIDSRRVSHAVRAAHRARAARRRGRVGRRRPHGLGEHAGHLPRAHGRREGVQAAAQPRARDEGLHGRRLRREELRRRAHLRRRRARRGSSARPVRCMLRSRRRADRHRQPARHGAARHARREARRHARRHRMPTRRSPTATAAGSRARRRSITSCTSAPTSARARPSCT